MERIADSHAIRFSNVSVVYTDTHTERPALNAVSLDIETGSWTVVLGQNGSGKSTLAKAAAGLCPLTEGSAIQGSGTRIQIVLQNPETQLLGETVLEELWLSMPEEELAVWTRRTQEERNLKLEGWLQETGLHVSLDHHVGKLSGGQKQLLAIAGCLAAGANTFVFDEATSMLDPGSRSVVLQAADRLHKKGATVLWITHRTEEAGDADRVVVLSEGRIAFDGSRLSFFYEGWETGQSPCERLGFEAPYAVQVARELLLHGYDLTSHPCTPRQLAEALAVREP